MGFAERVRSARLNRRLAGIGDADGRARLFRRAGGPRGAFRAQFEAAVAARRQKENELGACLATAVHALDDAERKIVLCRDTLVPQARQGIEVTTQAFAAGTADYLQLIDAQRTLLDVELLRERARVSRVQRVAEIEMLVGRDLSPTDADEVVGNPESRNGVR